MRILTFVLGTLAFGLMQADAQVLPDDKTEIGVDHPAFFPNRGPVVAVDSAHHNYHTIDNRYRPFAALLINDGFRVLVTNEPFRAKVLGGIKVLVVANASTTDGGTP